jgi:hypothetical protein
MKVGEVYFICERDRLDGTRTGCVKIGIVEDANQSSQKRLKQHQTGNPRDLELHHVTQTPAPHRVETFLHKRFGPNRARSEWFRLSDAELDLAVQAAEEMAKEAFQYISVITESKNLQRVVSSPEKVKPTVESTQWHRAWNEANAALNRCTELSERYKGIIDDLEPKERARAEEEELFVTEYVPIKTFDREGFAAKYPGLFEEYTDVEITVSGPCRKKEYDVALAEIDREFISFCSTFEDACSRFKQHEVDLGDLFDLHHILERFVGTYSWEREVADAHLRVICGSSAGIEGQVTWNRTAQKKVSLDEARLESDHPEEYKDFVTVKIQQRRKMTRRARRAVPPVS